MNKRMLVLIVALLVASLATRALAQVPQAGQTFAAVNEGVLTIYNPDGTSTAVNNPPNNGFYSIIWSPDGSKLAYLLTDQTYVPQLMVTDANGSDPVNVGVANLEIGFPITFTNDNQIVYITQGQQPADPQMALVVDVNQVAPEAGAQPQKLGSFSYMAGCGGGSMLPADWRYWEEAGFGGSPMMLQVTDFGLLHGTACAGLGVALLNFETGTDTPIGPDMLTLKGPSEGYGHIALSPDGQKFAAIYTSYSEPELTRSLAIIDLATLAVTDIKTTDSPQQIAWGNDGTLFYSTITATTNLVDTLTADEQKTLGDLTAMELRDYVVEIHHVNPTTGEDTSVYMGQGYAIGRMAATADGQGLVFSQVANVDAWVKAIANGTLDINTDFDGTAQRALVPITLYRLTLGGDQAVANLGENLTQFTLQPQAS